MSDRSHTRPGAGDDVLGMLSHRVRELQDRVSALESELEGAQRRLATYEQFDDSLQAAMSTALRAAHEIRTRSEESANQILEQAREERRILMKEIDRLRSERDSLGDQIAEMRRGGLTVARPPAPPDPGPTELRAVATEALRSIFEEVLQDVRARVVPPAQAARPTQPAASQAGAKPPQPAVPARPAPAAPAAPPERPAAMATPPAPTLSHPVGPSDASPAADVAAAEEAATMPPAARATPSTAPAPPPTRSAPPAAYVYPPAPPTPETGMRAAEPPAAARPPSPPAPATPSADERLSGTIWSPPAQSTSPQADQYSAPAPRPSAAPPPRSARPAEPPAPPTMPQAPGEATPVQRRAEHLRPLPSSGPAPAAPSGPPASSLDRAIVSPGAPERSAQEPAAPSTELQLVLSPVRSFPRLVEIERRIQSLPAVRTLYVRDFRNGVATLAVGLRAAMTAADFAGAVRTLDSPKFHLEHVGRNLVELRIDGEAATA